MRHTHRIPLTTIQSTDIKPGDLLYTSQGFRRVRAVRVDNRVTLATETGTSYLRLTDEVQIAA